MQFWRIVFIGTGSPGCNVLVVCAAIRLASHPLSAAGRAWGHAGAARPLARTECALPRGWERGRVLAPSGEPCLVGWMDKGSHAKKISRQV